MKDFIFCATEFMTTNQQRVMVMNHVAIAPQLRHVGTQFAS
jgi:hypothetical protein